MSDTCNNYSYSGSKKKCFCLFVDAFGHLNNFATHNRCEWNLLDWNKQSTVDADDENHNDHSNDDDGDDGGVGDDVNKVLIMLVYLLATSQDFHESQCER